MKTEYFSKYQHMKTEEKRPAENVKSKSEYCNLKCEDPIKSVLTG